MTIQYILLVVMLVLIFVVVHDYDYTSEPGSVLYDEGPINKDINLENAPFLLKVVPHETYDDLHQSLKDMGYEPHEDMLAYTTWSTLGEPLEGLMYCEIHTVLPEDRGDVGKIITLGHELLHCLYGEFHP